MFKTEKYIEESLNNRKSAGLYRSLKALPGMVDFCSNDYLGFSSTGILKEKIKEFFQNNPQTKYEGSTGSRLLSGNSAFAEKLENDIAKFHHAEAALIFNSGYDANIGLFSSVPQRNDTIFYDEYVHASIRDGIRLSYAKSFSFKHNDINHLEKLMTLAKGNVYIAIESIYSMDGDSAPLNELIVFCEKYQAHLIVDEAHATGVFGEKGRGFLNENNLEEKVFARVHTFGKALGTHGAAVIGSRLLKKYLINFARSFIYTTALPYHSLVSIHSAYQLLSENAIIQNKLHQNIVYFLELAAESKNINLLKSTSPIQSIIIKGNMEVSELANKIQQNNFDVRPIKSPTVPEGFERLRICLHSFNTQEEILRLLEFISQLKTEDFYKVFQVL